MKKRIMEERRNADMNEGKKMTTDRINEQPNQENQEMRTDREVKKSFQTDSERDPEGTC